MLWVSSTNEKDFTPSPRPSWMSTRVVRGRFGTGWRRLLADQVISPWLERWEKIDAVHYPKGWMPFMRLCHTKRIATLHDSIVQYYRLQYPGHFPRLKLWYFDRLTHHSLRQADRIMTPSHASAAALGELGERPAEAMNVIPTGLMRCTDASPSAPRAGILVLGSSLPHKATAETLRLLDGYCRQRGNDIPVTVTGIDGWDAIGRKPTTCDLNVDFAGRVPDKQLSQLMRTHRALVLLSEIEGFGLPALEAYACGMPVCYRSASSLAELLVDAPGGWDGRKDRGFDHALDEVLAMTPDQVGQIQKRFHEQYNTRSIAEAMLRVYREVMAGSAGSDECKTHA